MRVRTAQFLEGDILTRHRLDDIRAGDEHVRGLVDHDDEVCDGGGVDGSSGARAHDERDLRDDARGLHIAVEDLAVQAQGYDALLDPRTSRVVDADDRAASLEREVHDLDDLLAEDLSQGSAKHGEVLCEDAHGSPVDGAVAGDHAVAVGALGIETEVVRTVTCERVDLLEGTLVEECLDPLHRGELALGVLLVHGGLTAASRVRAALEEFLGLVRGGVRHAGCGGSRHARTLAG